MTHRLTRTETALPPTPMQDLHLGDYVEYRLTNMKQPRTTTVRSIESSRKFPTSPPIITRILLANNARIAPGDYIRLIEPASAKRPPAPGKPQTENVSTPPDPSDIAIPPDLDCPWDARYEACVRAVRLQADGYSRKDAVEQLRRDKALISRLKSRPGKTLNVAVIGWYRQTLRRKGCPPPTAKDILAHASGKGPAPPPSKNADVTKTPSQPDIRAIVHDAADGHRLAKACRYALAQAKAIVDQDDSRSPVDAVTQALDDRDWPDHLPLPTVDQVIDYRDRKVAAARELLGTSLTTDEAADIAHRELSEEAPPETVSKTPSGDPAPQAPSLAPDPSPCDAAIAAEATDHPASAVLLAGNLRHVIAGLAKSLDDHAERTRDLGRRLIADGGRVAADLTEAAELLGGQS